MSSVPIIMVAAEEGPSEITFQPPRGQPQSVQLKLRNTSSRLILFRMRLDGGDVKPFTVFPTDHGILLGRDAQRIELILALEVDETKEYCFIIETAFPVQNTGEPEQPMSLDANQLWKRVANEKTTKKAIPIRFDPGAAVGNLQGTIHISVIDPSESISLFDWRALEIYRYARSHHPQECSKLMMFVLCFAGFFFVVGLFAGMSLGGRSDESSQK